MAEYFPTERDAEELISGVECKDGKPPVIFGNDFQRRGKMDCKLRRSTKSGSSWHINVLEENSGEIRTSSWLPDL